MAFFVAAKEWHPLFFNLCSNLKNNNFILLSLNTIGIMLLSCDACLKKRGSSRLMPFIMTSFLRNMQKVFVGKS